MSILQPLMKKPFRVLSIDGGGMRGVYSAAYLAGLLDLFARERGVTRLDIGKGFDLIVGTSTGAILACAAAIGIPMDEVIQLYRENGPKIFPMRLPNGPASIPQLWTRPKYLKQGEKALREALQKVLKDKTLGQLYSERGIALSIPAVEMGQQRSWVFKTPHLNGHRDEKFRLVDICIATSAAPLFRSLALVPTNDGLGGNLVFADGGLWANNPVLVGLTDALKMAKNDRPIEIFALGTCPRPEGEQIKPSEVHRGLWGWKFGGKAMQLSLSAQEFAFDNMARMLAQSFSDLGRPVSVIRFPNGHVPADILQYLDLDDARVLAIDKLITQARADVNITKSSCDNPIDESGQQIARLMRDLPEIT